MSDHQNGLHLEAENWPRALFAVALAFSVFQVVTAAFPLISTQVLRATSDLTAGFSGESLMVTDYATPSAAATMLLFIQAAW